MKPCPICNRRVRRPNGKCAQCGFDRTSIDPGTPEQMLQEQQGAMLRFHVPTALQSAFLVALAAGRIRFDPATDCFVHPEAIEHGYGEYMMPGEYQ